MFISPKKAIVLAGAIVLIGAVANAQVVVDGVINFAEYGDPIWVNDTNPTGFGDNQDDTIGCANGSEIDGLYAVVAADGNGFLHLYLGLTGNLETNFNKLDIFLDTVEGVGQNQLPDINPDVDFGALQRMGDDGSGNGLKFDALYTANMYMTVTTGNCDGTMAEIYANFANLDTQEGWYLGQGVNGDGNLINGNNPFGIMATVDNSNILGVTDIDANYGDAAAVMTGWEIDIPFAAIGDPTSDILVAAFVNGGGHDWISSQVVGGGKWGNYNLADPRYVDFTALYGNQYGTVDNAGPRASAFIIHAGPLTGGQAADFGVEGASANSLVFWAYSLQGLGSTFVPPLGITLDLKKPAEAGRAKADANGDAMFSRNVPGVASGRTVWMQACEQGNTSNVIKLNVQ